jgi:hypothetical protein
MWAPARSRRRWESVGAAVTALVAAVIGVLWVSPDVAGAFHGPDTARTAGAAAFARPRPWPARPTPRGHRVR